MRHCIVSRPVTSRGHVNRHTSQSYMPLVSDGHSRVIENLN
jgi:hypothetical protein